MQNKRPNYVANTVGVTVGLLWLGVTSYMLGWLAHGGWFWFAGMCLLAWLPAHVAGRPQARKRKQSK